MKSRWNPDDAAAFPTELARRAYASRLLAAEPALAPSKGGITSVKVRETNVVGEEIDLLYVNGGDLSMIQPGGFASVRMDHLLKLAALESLSDFQAANELRAATLNVGGPSAPLEAVVHAVLPFAFVDHTHSHAFLAISNTPEGEQRLRDVYGDEAVHVPYVRPGFALARLCAERLSRQATARTIGMALARHGLISFGRTAQESYERMIVLVDRAERYLQQHGAWAAEPVPGQLAPAVIREELADFRRHLSELAGCPLLVSSHQDTFSLGFAQHPDAPVYATQGPAAPDDAVHTKRVPLVGRDLEAYAADYRAYYQQNAARSSLPGPMRDAAPRVVLDPQWGFLAVGANADEARVVEGIYRQTMETISRAVKLDGWVPLPAADVFAAEYRDPVQPSPPPAMFQGEVAFVTGGSSGIGRACLEELLARGAAAACLDVNPQAEELGRRPGALGLVGSVTDKKTVLDALEQVVRKFGGLDMLILNAGTFPKSRKIEELEDDLWEKTLGLNLDANLMLMRETVPLLRRAPRGGCVVIIGSKNVPAPGPGQAAYSASKAALTQLARVAALEWGVYGIRVNVVHPNAVFDTGIWTPEVLAQRAASYGLSVDEYRRSNVLRAEVTSRDVARAVAELCGPNFARTTGAQIAVDGGNDRVI
ncbi:MAG TPA: SDR family NAD(P)-dependent oxidoreductase [Chthoniobacterales bacterium]